MTDDPIFALGRRWVTAELSADVAELDALSVTDFTLVGPLGFVLDKEQWLDRYRSGAFEAHSLTWTDIAVRDYGDAAVVIGRYTQEASYQGRRSDGTFRCTQIVVRQDADWLLAGIHLSPIAGPPAAPTAEATS